MRKNNKVMVVTLLMALAVIAVTILVLLIPLFNPQLAVYVTIMALASMVALQKYVASLAAFFVLRFSKLFEVNDRVRIGTLKGDVSHIGLLHFLLDEVGEGEKFGGELTGRILHIPNHMVLDQPVLNFSQNFTVKGQFLACGYMFDEVRLQVSANTPLRKAQSLLEDILRQEDKNFRQQARKLYVLDAPTFLDEADEAPRVMVFAEGEKVFLVGKFVAPVRGRNNMKSAITLRFLEEVVHLKETAGLSELKQSQEQPIKTA